MAKTALILEGGGYRGIYTGGVLDVGDGVAHFDPNSKPHSHFSCTVCGSVMDVPAVEIDPLWENTSVVPGKVQGISILFSGCCNHCLSGNRV